MIVSLTLPTLALTNREVCLALACRAPLDDIPQTHRAGEWLELQFRDVQERDLWMMMLETAFERADMDMLPVQTVADEAALPYPVSPAHGAPNALLYTAFWLALLVAGGLALLGLFTR